MKRRTHLGLAIASMPIALALVVPEARASQLRPLAATSCHASVSNAAPAQYSTVQVHVSTVGGASVTTVAHFKTKDTTHAALATGGGQAATSFPISRATKGYRVVVSVFVHKGSASGACSTGFTPH